MILDGEHTFDKRVILSDALDLEAKNKIVLQDGDSKESFCSSILDFTQVIVPAGTKIICNGAKIGAFFEHEIYPVPNPDIEKGINALVDQFESFKNTVKKEREKFGISG